MDTYEYADQALAKIYFKDSSNEEVAFAKLSPKLAPFSKKKELFFIQIK